MSNSLQQPETPDLKAYARERLRPHRESLKILANMDTELSEQAQTALTFLKQTDSEGDHE